MSKKYSVLSAMFLCFVMILNSVLITAAEEADICEIIVGEGDYTDNTLTPGTYDGAWQKLKAIRIGGIGGKSADDIASCIEVTKDQSSFRSIRYHYDITRFKSDFWLTTDMYVSHGAVGSLSFGSGNKYFDISGDGTVTCGPGSGNITLDRKVDTNAWHRVILMFTLTDSYSLTLFLDGDVVDTWNIGKLAGSRSTLAFCADYGSTMGSRVAFDNTALCEGVYDPEQDPYVKPEITVNEDKVSLQNGVVCWEDSKISTVSDLLSAVYGGENTIRIFKDSTLSEEVFAVDESSGFFTVLTGDEYIAVESPSGVFSYYPTLKAKLEVTNVDLIGDNSAVGAKALLSNTTSTPQNVVMMIVFFDKNGVMKKIVSSDDIIVSGTDSTIQIDPVPSEGLDAHVLFIDSWSSRLRVFDDIFIINNKE